MQDLPAHGGAGQSHPQSVRTKTAATTATVQWAWPATGHEKLRPRSTSPLAVARLAAESSASSLPTWPFRHSQDGGPLSMTGSPFWR